MIKLDYMFEAGFFGTRAPIFMDVVTLIVALLPFLVAGAIYLAKDKKYKLHALAQVFIFAFSTIVIVYFETGVRMVGGFEFFMQESGVSYNYALIVLVFHIAISVITLILWTKTIFMAKKQVKLNKHKKSGMMTFAGIVMTSLTGIWVYFLMFVF
ncbi:MAG: putative membrane protein [Sulfurimonas sp.]|jgi:putative membrane protein